MMKQPRQSDCLRWLKLWPTHQARLIPHGLENRAKTSRTIIPGRLIHVMLLIVNPVAWPEGHAQNFGNVRTLLAENLPSEHMNVSRQINRSIHVADSELFEPLCERVYFSDCHKTLNVVAQQYVWDKVIFRKTESDDNTIHWEDCGHGMEEVKPDYNKSLGPAATRQARTLSLRREHFWCKDEVMENGRAARFPPPAPARHRRLSSSTGGRRFTCSVQVSGASVRTDTCSILGKPTVTTVPPNFTARLAATGNGANPPRRFEQRQIIQQIHLLSQERIWLSKNATVNTLRLNCEIRIVWL
jgi:hypothetical protein